VISELRDSTAHVFVDSIDAPALNEIDAHHLLRVLRVKPSDAVTISDGKGKWYSGILNADATIEATSEVFTTAAQSWPLTVAFSLVKGIDEIVVLAPTVRSVVRWDHDRSNKNIERLRRVAREAAMQSRRTWLPNVLGVIEMSTIANLFIADPTGDCVDASHRSIAVGPEGGFAPHETESCSGLVSLGETILRAETAAVSAAVLMSDYRRKQK
jgi:16S rRNA (uracil1498-N3)-methyltransferase